jgi:hypothetical protein
VSPPFPLPQSLSLSSSCAEPVLLLIDLGVPIKLLHEAEGHPVSIELKTGELYRGVLEEAEDTMNCRLKEGMLDS